MDDTQLDRWRAAIGANAERYLKRFKRIEAKGGWAPGWNMAVFLHSTGWFCYRRMFLWAGLNLLAPFIVLFLLLAIGLLTPLTNLDALAAIVAILYLLAVFVLLPVFADSLYFRQIGNRLADPRATAPAPSAWTLAGALGTGAAWLCMAYIVLVPAYGGYTPRAKVSEAVLSASPMRTEVTEFFEKERRLPRAEEAGQFRADPLSKYVQSVVYEPAQSRIVVTLREVQPGKRFALYAATQDGKLSWMCRTIDLDRKYLPGTCRE